MKCDEKRDVCGPCERSGRECVYKDENEASTSTTLQAVAVVAQTEVRKRLLYIGPEAALPLCGGVKK